MEADTIQVEWLTEAKQAQETARSEQGKTCKETEPAQKEISKMPELTQAREGGRTYLLCACEEICDDEEAMLADNRPEGLLAITKKCVNGRMQLTYDMTGKLSLAGYYEKKEIGYGGLCAILLSVHCCLNRMEEYLLSEDNVVFCPSYVYTNMSGRQLYFVYLPIVRGTFSEHIRELAHFLLEHVDYQDERAVALAGQFYQYAEAENFSMTVFLEENREYFEEADKRKEQGDQADDVPAEEGWMKEDGYPPEREERQGKGKQAACIGLAVTAMIGLMAWPFSWNPQMLMSVGVCAGVAAGVIFWYIRWARRTLAKKERELFFIDGYGPSGETVAAVDPSVSSERTVSS